MLSAAELIVELRALSTPEHLASQSRFGIRGKVRLGVSLYDLRRLAKGQRGHDIALDLWKSGLHEARMLAAMVDDPTLVSKEQMEAWVSDFDSWDLCDVVTDELFIHTQSILEIIPQWAVREEEFVKRAAFASIAALVVHRKDIPDTTVSEYFKLIESAAGDNRNFVKKAVNWALRNIGKWRPVLRSEALLCAERLLNQDTPSARWIARDAIKEFNLKFGGRDEDRDSI